jgi:hypothetical protein
MDLWVKSPDNDGFIRVHEVYLFGCSVNANSRAVTFRRGHYAHGLRTYATPERAKEVISEIWRVMLENSLGDIFYEMPKE